MLFQLTGRKVTIVRMRDGKALVGEVREVRLPMLLVTLVDDIGTQVGDLLEFGMGDGRSYAKISAEVASVDADYSEVWVTTQQVVPAVDRAERVPAYGMPALIAGSAGEDLPVALVDVSDTGLLVTCMSCPPIGAITTVKTEFSGGVIELEAKVVRVSHPYKKEHLTCALHVLSADRLSRARWGHLVANLKRRHGRAA